MNTAPDGDSLHFLPDHPDSLVQNWPDLRRHPDGAITVRLDGVDAPETHYLASGGLGVLRQPAPWPEMAAESLLRFLGFAALRRRSDECIVATTPAAVHGAIALRRVDRYGRAVAFAFRGHVSLPPAGRLTLTAPVVESSANWQLLWQGLAYPVFYQDMPDGLKAHLCQASRAAQSAGRGLWPQDCTRSGFALTSLDALQCQGLLWPKLFRRLVDHVGGNGGRLSLSSFGALLEAEVGSVLLWEQACPVDFADLVALEGNRLRLLVAPDAIAFAED